MNTPLPQATENQLSFEYNRNGRLSGSQTRNLLLWFAKNELIFGIGGSLLAFALTGWGRYLAISVTVLITTTFAWSYCIDLIKHDCVLVTGIIHKETRQYRGPTRYEVVVANQLRIRCFRKADWLALQQDHSYNLFYSQRTKWLLSWEKSHNELHGERSI